MKQVMVVHGDGSAVPSTDPDLRIVSSPLVQPGHMMLMADPSEFNSMSSVDLGRIRFEEDLWGPAPYRLSEYGASERRRGLDHLAGLLDELCTSVGLDPDTTWRQPRLWRRDRNRIQYIATARVAMTVRRPETFLRITGV